MGNITAAFLVLSTLHVKNGVPLFVFFLNSNAKSAPAIFFDQVNYTKKPVIGIIIGVASPGNRLE